MSGPPLHIPRRVALAEYTLPELLAAWLHTRQALREEAARRLQAHRDDLTDLALFFAMPAEQIGHYRREVRELGQDIRDLLQPERPAAPFRSHAESDDPFLRAAHQPPEAGGGAPRAEAS